MDNVTPSRSVKHPVHTAFTRFDASQDFHIKTYPWQTATDPIASSETPRELHGPPQSCFSMYTGAKMQY